MRVFLQLSVVGLLWVALTAPVVAMMVLPVDLNELVTAADRIIMGTVQAVEERKDERSLPSTYVTVHVSQSIKGNPPTLFTFKQLGGTGRQENGSLLRISGLPTYRVGQEVILFLHPTSTAGFTSPVGMGQGAFTVVRHDAKAQVVNGLGNANLVPPLASRSQQRGLQVPSKGMPVDLDRFLSLVEELANKPQERR